MVTKVRVGSVWTGRRRRVRSGTSWQHKRLPIETQRFTTNGADWPAGWTIGKTPTNGGGLSTTGGSGVLATGTTGGYTNNDTISVASTSTPADIDMRFDFQLPATQTPSLNVIFRSDQQNLESGNCYSLDIRAGNVDIVEAKAWSYITHATVTKTVASSVWHSCRVAATGGLVRARIWPQGQAEPATWDVTTSFGPKKTAGYFGFSVPGPGEAGGKRVLIANVERWEPWQRDRNTVPFAATSIWNTPIGTGATYSPMNMTVPAHGYSIDDGYIVLTPGAPLRSLINRGYWWPYPQSGYTPTDSGIDVRVPDDYVIPAPPAGNYPNRGTAMIRSDGQVQEFQYTVRASAGSDVEYHESLRAVYDLAGDGLTGPNGFGAHGGAGMTVIGGTMRDTDLSNPGRIGHALAITMNTWKYAVQEGGGIVNGKRWPAIAADGNWASAYGTFNNGANAVPGVGMGSLLAIPHTVDLAALALETTIGSKIAQAMQEYGGYVVDSIGSASNDDWHWNATREAWNAYPEMDAWGDPTPPNTPYRRDMDKIIPLIAVVTNSVSAETAGGGGVPIVPWSPPAE